MRNARRGKHVARRSSMLTLSNVRRVLSIEISTDFSFIEFFASIHWSLHRVSLISSLNSPLTRWANSLRVTHKSPSHAYRERSKAAATCWMVFIEILANYSVCSHQWRIACLSRIAWIERVRCISMFLFWLQFTMLEIRFLKLTKAEIPENLSFANSNCFGLKLLQTSVNLSSWKLMPKLMLSDCHPKAAACQCPQSSSGLNN